MKITYHGYSCFSLKTAKALIVTDPYPETLGIKMPNLKADIVTISHQHENHSYAKGVSGDFMILDYPGEYERKEVYLHGIASFHNKKEAADLGENILFVMNLDGLVLCHLGDLGCKLPPEQLEALGDVDVLMIPVGGGSTLDAVKALEVIDQIEPKIVIPMHYQLDGMKTNLALVEKFLEVMGKKEVEQLTFLELAKSALPHDTTEVKLLQAMHE